MRILDHPYWARLREKFFGPSKPDVPVVQVTYCEPGNAEGSIQSPIWRGVGRGIDPIKYLG